LLNLTSDGLNIAVHGIKSSQSISLGSEAYEKDESKIVDTSTKHLMLRNILFDG
jgi:hypothetical protein